jgi:hypothetical protein
MGKCAVHREARCQTHIVGNPVRQEGGLFLVKRLSGGNVVGIREGRCWHRIERRRVERLSITHVVARIDRNHEVLVQVTVVIGVDTVE